jgi:hypothetical protein
MGNFFRKPAKTDEDDQQLPPEIWAAIYSNLSPADCLRLQFAGHETYAGGLRHLGHPRVGDLLTDQRIDIKNEQRYFAKDTYQRLVSRAENLSSLSAERKSIIAQLIHMERRELKRLIAKVEVAQMLGTDARTEIDAVFVKLSRTIGSSATSYALMLNIIGTPSQNLVVDSIVSGGA